MVERGPDGKPAKLVGILTNRDVRFADDPHQPVAGADDPQDRHRAARSATQDEAKRLLHQHRIEKLLVVDDAYRCVGLITVKDIEKATAHPHAAKDGDGRLRVAAAIAVGDQGFERARAPDRGRGRRVVVDTAHGHSERVLRGGPRGSSARQRIQIIAGNVATAEARRR